MYLSFETTQRFGKKSAFNVIMCCITHLPLPRRKKPINGIEKPINLKSKNQRLNI